MESYPTQLLAHLAPLVVVQGVDHTQCKFLPVETTSRDVEEVKDNPLLRSTEQLKRSHPPIASIPFVEDVLKIWRKYHVDGVAWDSNSTKQHIPTHPHRYRLKPVDQYSLPKKSKPSPISPLTEGSPTHSNGMLSLEWVQKYRAMIPCIYISFYGIDTEITDPLSVEKADEELSKEINTLREQLTQRNIKLLAIIVSERSTALNPELEERVNSIRRLTGMNSRNGILLLSSGTQKEVSLFALNILQIIKIVSSEFYSNLDKVICQRRAKSLAAIDSTSSATSKSITEVRYSLKLGFLNEMRQQYDLSVKNFETGYENLVELLNAMPIESKDWNHTRLLLDITLFHIVRIYFYLEQTNTAFKKFDIHLQSVIYFLKQKNVAVGSFSVCCWLSQQFKWLAQLSDLSPTSLVPSEVPYKVDSLNKVSPLVLPHSGYLYLQSVDLWRRKGTIDQDEHVDPYAKTLENENFEESLINLLKFSKLAFQKKDNTFNRSIAYVNYQLAEEYFKLKDFDKAFNCFEQTLDCLKEDDWSYLLAVVHLRLLECSIELKKYYSSVLNLLELSILPQNLMPKGYINKANKLTNKESNFKTLLQSGEQELVINTAMDSSLDVFETSILFKTATVPLSRDVQMQLKVKSKTNDVLDSTVLDDLLLTFDGTLSSVVLNHDPTAELKCMVTLKDMEYDSEKNCYLGTANLQFKSLEQKIFNIIISALKIGKNTCSSVSGTMSYHDGFKVKLSTPISNNAFKYYHSWTNTNGTQDVIGTNDPSSCEVIPRVPETKVTLVDVPTSVIAGEKLKIILSIKNEDHENVDVDISADIVLGEQRIEHIWDGSEKNNLELTSIEKSTDARHVLSFQVPSVSKDDEQRTINLVVNVIYYVNHDKDVPIKDSIEFTLPIMDPFDITVSIYPRIRDDDMPSAFEIEDKDTGVTKPARFWLMRTNIVMKPGFEISVLEDELGIKSLNEHVICREITADRNWKKTEGKIISDHFVETVIADGHTYRNIGFEATLRMKWQRKGCDDVDEYIHEKWKLSLPLLDPRVLLDVETNEENNDLVLNYLIENPTSRVFSFSTNMIENQSFQVSGTKSLNQLSVLPCTRQPLVFHATPLTAGWLQLPQLKVYDLNYRVNLPTLPISDTAQSHKQEVYVRVSE